MLQTHFEDVVKSEAQVVEDDEVAQSVEGEHGEIIQINYAENTHQMLEHLKAILDTVKNIHQINKKIKNDPLRSQVYEQEKWKLFNRVTVFKDKYYA